jgi:hypothetical protein
MGPTAVLPFGRKACWGCLFALNNPTVSAWFEPANLRIKSQHDTSRPPKPLTGELSIFQLLGSLKVNNFGCTCGIRSRIAMVHAAFNNEKTLFNSKTGRILGRNEQIATFGPYILCRWKLDSSKSRPKILRSAGPIVWGRSITVSTRTDVFYIK